MCTSYTKTQECYLSHTVVIHRCKKNGKEIYKIYKIQNLVKKYSNARFAISKLNAFLNCKVGSISNQTHTINFEIFEGTQMMQKKKWKELATF